MQRFDPGWGHEFARFGTPTAELELEIVQRLGTVDETTVEMIRETIVDALAGRRLRWCSWELCPLDRCRGPRERCRPAITARPFWPTPPKSSLVCQIDNDRAGDPAKGR